MQSNKKTSTPRDTPASSSTKQTKSGPDAVALCASCDRCRARKTKCDGARPCGNCAAKYLKKNKLSSIEGIDISLFECVYSPAKRRGPVPGRINNARKNQSSSSQNNESSLADAPSVSSVTGLPPLSLRDIENAANVTAPTAPEMKLPDGSSNPDDLYRHAAASANSGGGIPGMSNFLSDGFNLEGSLANQQIAAQQQLNYLQQLQAQQQQLMKQMETQPPIPGVVPPHPPSVIPPHPPPPPTIPTSSPQPSAPTPLSTSSNKLLSHIDLKPEKPVARTVIQHTHLLSLHDPDGNRLRAYYALSIDELFQLPPIPTDDQYCTKISVAMKPSLLPRFDVAALQAGRFAEVALGALVGDQLVLSLELGHATVMCLRECVEEPVHPSCMFDVARAYFLHAILRGLRGDFERFFKYRRVCLTHISQLDNIPDVSYLLAALSITDSWVYMLHNANAPPISPHIPPLPPLPNPPPPNEKYNIITTPSSIASHPDNQTWIQGPPPVFITHKAPPHSRSLDALSCAMRSCADQANQHSGNNSNHDNGYDSSSSENASPPVLTPTSRAVLANQAELCSRSMVLSAFTLLQLHEASTPSLNKNQGHHVIISAMDAFLEGGRGGSGNNDGEEDEDEDGLFTDSQIQSLLSVCAIVLENPLLLFQSAPTYHMVSNVAIFLCHLMNMMHRRMDEWGDFERALFEEILDNFTAVKRILNNHRRKLPRSLRCHSIPHPSLKMDSSCDDGSPFVNLDDVIMCPCHACQGFVLISCHPQEARERSRLARERRKLLDDMCNDNTPLEDKDVHNLGARFETDEDLLLNVLSRIIGT